MAEKPSSGTSPETEPSPDNRLFRLTDGQRTLIEEIVVVSGPRLDGLCGRTEELVNEYLFRELSAIPASTPTRRKLQKIQTLARKLLSEIESLDEITLTVIDIHLNTRDQLTNLREAVDKVSRYTGSDIKALLDALPEIGDALSTISDPRVRNTNERDELIKKLVQLYMQYDEGSPFRTNRETGRQEIDVAYIEACETFVDNVLTWARIPHQKKSDEEELDQTKQGRLTRLIKAVIRENHT
jgi:hypothetical protein